MQRSEARLEEFHEEAGHCLEFLESHDFSEPMDKREREMVSISYEDLGIDWEFNERKDKHNSRDWDTEYYKRPE